MVRDTNYIMTGKFLLSAHRSMWSVTNYFLVNLTLADLLMSTLNCIPSFIFMRDRSVSPSLSISLQGHQILFQSLDLWLHLLPDQQLRLLHDGLPERVHPVGHQCGQEEGKKIMFDSPLKSPPKKALERISL